MPTTDLPIIGDHFGPMAVTAAVRNMHDGELPRHARIELQPIDPSVEWSGRSWYVSHDGAHGLLQRVVDEYGALGVARLLLAGVPGQDRSTWLRCLAQPETHRPGDLAHDWTLPARPDDTDGVLWPAEMVEAALESEIREHGTPILLRAVCTEPTCPVGTILTGTSVDEVMAAVHQHHQAHHVVDAEVVDDGPMDGDAEPVWTLAERIDPIPAPRGVAFLIAALGMLWPGDRLSLMHADDADRDYEWQVWTGHPAGRGGSMVGHGVTEAAAILDAYDTGVRMVMRRDGVVQ